MTMPNIPIPTGDESQGSYNGPLSTYRECHSLLIGVAGGALLGWSTTLRHDLRAEPHYAIGGALVAALVAFVLRQR
jgi:hypothetical protein